MIGILYYGMHLCIGPSDNGAIVCSKFDNFFLTILINNFHYMFFLLDRRFLHAHCCNTSNTLVNHTDLLAWQQWLISSSKIILLLCMWGNVLEVFLFIKDCLESSKGVSFFCFYIHIFINMLGMQGIYSTISPSHFDI